VTDQKVRPLSKWSGKRVGLTCVLWLLGAPVVGAIGLILAGLVLDLLSGSRKISFTARLTDWTLGWLFFPPIALVAAWLWNRKGASGAALESDNPPS
jgi:hypothetical protein